MSKAKRVRLLIIFLLIFRAHLAFGEEGIASYYGGGKNEKLNKYTASGEVFNPAMLTCASWHYPFGTLLLVTNIRTGASVVVRVNDRGPNKRLERAIDLSREAFSRIESLSKGLCEVRIEKIEQ